MKYSLSIHHSISVSRDPVAIFVLHINGLAQDCGNSSANVLSEAIDIETYQQLYKPWSEIRGEFKKMPISS